MKRDPLNFQSFDDTVDAQLEFDFLDKDAMKNRTKNAVEMYSNRDIKKTRRLEKLGRLSGHHLRHSKKEK